MGEVFSPATELLRDRFAGCLLGGAVGDALGAPVEFMSRDEILQQHGPAGIREYASAYGQLGAITDDTQMTLFTAEGLLRAWVRGNLRGICHTSSVIALAFQRWLSTQDVAHPLHKHCVDGWLVKERRLHARRAPGRTCVEALRSMEHSGTRASNQSKGCGGVMRVAPIGLFYARLTQMRSNYSVGDPYSTQEAFDLGCDAAAITHGHVTAQLASCAFAAVIMAVAMGAPLSAAIQDALQIVRERPGHEETSRAMEHAIHLAAQAPDDPRALAQLGEGWVAEEALAIAIYCALGAKDFRSCVELAVSHDGDSDSTGSMVGQILGASQGTRAIPASWLSGLELRDVIACVADDLVQFPDVDLNADDTTLATSLYLERYPGV
jgi:ADP-ribosylglycohydrolase